MRKFVIKKGEDNRKSDKQNASAAQPNNSSSSSLDSGEYALDEIVNSNKSLNVKRKENKTGEQSWSSKLSYLLSIIGFVVGFGNFWLFPSTCFLNGGASFLIPYFIFLVVLGVPLVYIELAMGQVFRNGCISVWDSICPWLKGIGISIVIMDMLIQGYFNTVTGYTLHFLFSSMQSVLPWSNFNVSLDNSNYFAAVVQKSTNATGLNSLGELNVDLIPYVILVLVCVYASTYKGAVSIGKAVYVTALFPYFLLAILLIRSLTLEGASDGIKALFSADVEKLKDLTVWFRAAIQICYSLGPGSGVLIAYGSYGRDQRVNLRTYSIIVALTNSMTSIFCAVVVYSGLGFMSHSNNVSIETYSKYGQNIIFVVYPEILTRFNQFAPVFAVIFFLTLFLILLNSVYAEIEGVHAALSDEIKVFRRYVHGSKIFLLLICFLIAIPSITYGGKYYISFLVDFGISPNTFLVLFLELLGVCYIYGYKNFVDKLMDSGSPKPSVVFRLLWMALVPALMLVLYITSFVFYKPSSDTAFGSVEATKLAHKGGFILNLFTALPIPLYALYRLIAPKKYCAGLHDKLISIKERSMRRRRNSSNLSNVDDDVNV